VKSPLTITEMRTHRERGNDFPARTKPFSQATKTVGNRDTIQSLPIKQLGSIMWSIIPALIYYFIILPGWLTA
jgi:hypothetical protein